MPASDAVSTNHAAMSCPGRAIAHPVSFGLFLAEIR
jgi:hypothetical protein